MKRTIIIFGSLCAILILLFQIEKWSLFTMGMSENHLYLLIGICSLIIGIIASRYFFVKREDKLNNKKKASLSIQEHKVLLLVSEGLSNKEIAAKLFIAETTVKTHVSNILSKLGAKRRTEAVKIGRELNII